MKVFKYTLQVGLNEVYLPKVHTILNVGIVGGQTVMYALVDEYTPKEEISICVALTGEYIDSGFEYIGTVVHKDGCAFGDFVLHVFNGGKP